MALDHLDLEIVEEPTICDLKHLFFEYIPLLLNIKKFYNKGHKFYYRTLDIFINLVDEKFGCGEEYDFSDEDSLLPKKIIPYYNRILDYIINNN